MSGDGDQAYIDRARADPAVKKMTTTTLMALGFHLWAMTKAERSQVTVEGLRESRHLQHGYITDAEIAAEIVKANAFRHVDPSGRRA